MKKSQSAMIFAAGYGRRLKPLTDHTPKPLLPVNGVCCLDRHIKSLESLNFTNIIINTHHLSGAFCQHLKGKTNITLLKEDVLLETGGGVKNALPHLGETILLINGDIWLQSECIIKIMMDAFDPIKMDGLLLLIPLNNALFFDGSGDYFVESSLPEYADQNQGHRIVHKIYKGQNRAPFVFGGIQIWKKSILQTFDSSKKSFSMLDVFHDADKKNKLFGLISSTKWCDIGTITAYKSLDEYLKRNF
ncbi:MAG: N-acetylmuramate alpha-1-phosphate uridylyltransferase [Holosporales bacterium]